MFLAKLLDRHASISFFQHTDDLLGCESFGFYVT